MCSYFLKLLTLDNNEDSVIDKLLSISNILKHNSIEFWLLLDEFQEVVDQWDIKDNAEFLDLCDCLYQISNIRIVLCGSDELVKIILSENSIWSPIIAKAKPLEIGSLKEDGFCEMLRDSQVWSNSLNPFTDAALKYMYVYTGGNAIYGKLLGNMIIKQIENGAFENREWIYPSDISEIIKEMLAKQKTDLQKKQSGSEIITHMTKNLGTESKYLKFIADKLQKNRHCVSVSISDIYENFSETAASNRDEIITSLKVCCARGILDDAGNKDQYRFTTMFHYNWYSYMAETYGVDIELGKMEEIDIFPIESPQDVIITKFEEIPDSQAKQEVFSKLYYRLDSKEKLELRDNLFLPIYTPNIMIQNDTSAISDLKAQMIEKRNIIEVQGSAEGAQFQQETTNSTQIMSTIVGINYDKVLKLLVGIEEASHDANFKEDVDKSAHEYKKLISETFEMIEKKEDSSKIKNSLFELKSMAEKVLISMVASGISTQITQFFQ